MIYVALTTKVPACKQEENVAELTSGGLRFDYIGRSRHKPELLQRNVAICLVFKSIAGVKVLIPDRVVLLQEHQKT